MASKRVPAGDIRNVAAARFLAGGGAADASAWFLLMCLMFSAQVAGAAAASTRNALCTCCTSLNSPCLVSNQSLLLRCADAGLLLHITKSLQEHGIWQKGEHLGG